LKIPIDDVEKAKKAELKCAILVEEDLISDEDLNGVGNNWRLSNLNLSTMLKSKRKKLLLRMSLT